MSKERKILRRELPDLQLKVPQFTDFNARGSFENDINHIKSARNVRINPNPIIRKNSADKNLFDIDNFSTLPAIDEMIIPEKDLKIDNLLNYIVSVEKRVPIFGYPIVSFHLNSHKLDRIKFLWGIVAKKIISRDTDRWLIKDLIDGYKAGAAREKNIFTSFTYGRSPSTSRCYENSSQSDNESDSSKISKSSIIINVM